eukprot:gene11219-18846_t
MSPALAEQSGRDQLQMGSKYEKISDLNSGAFGFVHLCKNTVTGNKVAVKYISRGDEVFLTPQHLAIAMEFVPGGDLYDYVDDNPGESWVKLFDFGFSKNEELDSAPRSWVGTSTYLAPEQLDSGPCSWVGTNTYLAPQAIMSSNNHAIHPIQSVSMYPLACAPLQLDSAPRPCVGTNTYLAPKLDSAPRSWVGTNTYLAPKLDSAPRSWVGTNTYLAPEVIMSSGEATYDGKMADVWCLGVMLYAMLEGDYPFERPEDDADGNNTRKLQRLIMRILKAEYTTPVKASEDCADLLTKILVTDPTKRISIEGIKAHPWFCQDLSPRLSSLNTEISLGEGPDLSVCKQDISPRLSSLSTGISLSQGPELSLCKQDISPRLSSLNAGVGLGQGAELSVCKQTPEDIKKLSPEDIKKLVREAHVRLSRRSSETGEGMLGYRPSVEMDALIDKELKQPPPIRTTCTGKSTQKHGELGRQSSETGEGMLGYGPSVEMDALMDKELKQPPSETGAYPTRTTCTGRSMHMDQNRCSYRQRDHVHRQKHLRLGRQSSEAGEGMLGYTPYVEMDALTVPQEVHLHQQKHVNRSNWTLLFDEEFLDEFLDEEFLFDEEFLDEEFKQPPWTSAAYPRRVCEELSGKSLEVDKLKFKLSEDLVGHVLIRQLQAVGSERDCCFACNRCAMSSLGSSSRQQQLLQMSRVFIRQQQKAAAVTG